MPMLWLSPTHQTPAQLKEALGFIPTFLSDDDPRPARAQIHANYRHGGGWIPAKGFRLDPDTMTLNYPGDPPLNCIAASMLRDEMILVYPHAWVVILCPDGTYEVSRCD